MVQRSDLNPLSSTMHLLAQNCGCINSLKLQNCCVMPISVGDSERLKTTRERACCRPSNPPFIPICCHNIAEDSLTSFLTKEIYCKQLPKCVGAAKLIRNGISFSKSRILLLSHINTRYRNSFLILFT